MRITRLKLTSEVKKLLAVQAKTFAVDDPGFVEDMFALMRTKGAGLPDRARITLMSATLGKKYKKAPASFNLLISKRKMILERLIKLPYFLALAKSRDAIQAVERMLTTFITMYRKVRQAQCLSCHLKTNCAFGTQYGDVMANITKVIDPNYDKKVHPDCPSRPEISAANQLYAAVSAFQQMMKPSGLNKALSTTANQNHNSGEQADVQPSDDVAVGQAELVEDDDDSAENADPDDAEDYLPSTGVGFGRKSYYDGQHTVGNICRVTEALVRNISNSQLAIFELGKKFSLALDGKDSKSFKPVAQVEQDQTQRQMESLSDLPKVVSSSHGLPPEVFDARLENKQLDKTQFTKPDEKRKLLYLLIDSSGSMGAHLGQGGNAHSLFTRASLSVVMALALCEKLKKDKGYLYIRFFGGHVSKPLIADKPSDFDHVELMVSRNNFSAGGTDITAAVEAAVEDINKADAAELISDAEILCITDCEDSVNGQRLLAAAQKREFHILDVAGNGKSHNAQLKLAASKYLKVNEDSPDVNNLVKQVV